MTTGQHDIFLSELSTSFQVLCFFCSSNCKMALVTSANQAGASRSSPARPNGSGSQPVSSRMLSAQSSSNAVSVQSPYEQQQVTDDGNNMEPSKTNFKSPAAVYDTSVYRFTSKTQHEFYLYRTTLAPATGHVFVFLLYHVRDRRQHNYEDTGVCDFLANVPRENDKTAQLLFLRDYPSSK